MERAVYIWADSLDDIMINAAEKLRKQNRVKILYTVQGEMVRESGEERVRERRGESERERGEERVRERREPEERGGESERKEGARGGERRE